MFFSEEKNQKTFVPQIATRYGTWPDIWAALKIKVFCYFSSLLSGSLTAFRQERIDM